MSTEQLKINLKDVPGLNDLITKSAFTDAMIRIAGHEGLLPSHFGDVKAFHQKFGLLVGESPRHLTRRKLKERVECLLEELTEFAEACGLNIYGGDDGEVVVGDGYMIPSMMDQDLPAQADALIDLVYFALGTAVMMGLPWQQLWDDVQRANLSKVRGETKRGHKVDVTKPEGWVGPQGEKILIDHGYQRGLFEDEFDHIDEATCHDDV